MASVKTTFEKELTKQFYDVILKSEVSEKSTRLMEFENKLVFEVARKASKPIIKLLIENEFKKSVKSVNTVNSITGKKKAIITFKDENAASDIASDIGLV